MLIIAINSAVKMSTVETEWLTAYAALELSLPITVLHAITAYYQWVQGVVERYRELKPRLQVVNAAVWRDDPILCHLMVRWKGMQLRHVAHQTPKICLAALKQCGLALQYVKEQTLELCAAAVHEEPEALQWVQLQYRTPELCMNAVAHNGWVLQWVPHPTPAMIEAALTNHGVALRWVTNPTYEQCRLALQSESEPLEFIPADMQAAHPDLCEIAIDMDAEAIQYVHNQTPELCLRAIHKKPWVIESSLAQTRERCLAAVQKDGNALPAVDPEEVPDSYCEICQAAIKQQVTAFEYVDTEALTEEQYVAVCLLAVGIDPGQLKNVDANAAGERYAEICDTAGKSGRR